MADKKISQLTAASTPLVGTEVFPIVQSSATVKATIANVQVAPVASATANTIQYLNASKVPSSDANLSYVSNNVGIGTSSPNKTGFDANAVVATINGPLRGAIELGGTSPVASNMLGGVEFISGSTNKGYLRCYLDGSSNAYLLTQLNLSFGTAGKGIDFSANTHAAGMTSELLNWYEEGTWTGGVSFGGAATGITYNNTLGYYTRVGNVVTVSAYINMSSKGSATGAARITGLPFTCANNAAAYAAPSLFFTDLTYSGQVCGYVNINNTTIDLTQTTEAGTNSALTNTNFTNATSFILNLTYRAA